MGRYSRVHLGSFWRICCFFSKGSQNPIFMWSKCKNACFNNNWQDNIYDSQILFQDAIYYFLNSILYYQQTFFDLFNV